MVESNPWPIVADLARVFEAMGVRYAVGGSLASGLSGEPRSTLDADVTVDLRPEQVEAFTEQVIDRFYVPIDRLRRAAREHLSAHVIHMDTAMKVDLFIAGGTPIDEAVLQRRLAFTPRGIDQRVYMHSAEDVLLHKLRRFRKGGETSDRQWRDVIGIVRVQGQRLDRAYLVPGAALLGVTDLLERALAQE